MQENQYTEQELKLIRKNKREKILVIILLIMFFPTIYLGVCIYDDWCYHNFIDQLFNCPLPEGTVLLECKSAEGNLQPNGNNWNYLAIILIESDKSAEELQTYFEQQEFYYGEERKKRISPMNIDVQKAEGEIFESDYAPYMKNKFKYMETVQSTENLYYVTIFERTSFLNLIL